MLAAGLGGLTALVAGALARPSAAEAAAGDSLIIGSSTNNAGTTNTILTTSSSVVAFELIQNGPGTALMGYVTPASGGTRGVYGRSDSPNGFGVQARNGGAAGSGAAVQAFGGNNTGIDASTANANRYAVYGTNTGGGTGVAGTTTGTGTGVYGGTSSGRGVHGFAGSGDGVHGEAGSGAGVSGVSASWFGVSGTSTSSSGVFGSSSSNYGIFGSSNSSDGVHGGSSGQFGAGVSGNSVGTEGHGVVGSISTNSGNASGVYGASAGSSSYAGYFEGHVGVTGTLSKGGGSFRIDHPLAPTTKILQHSFVESPDMLNIYNGVATADAKGEATVELPAWFMALNRDFRYGLTPIGVFAPLFVKTKVANGRFTIAGAKPGQEVSWQLTGIRRDAWANANRIQVELDKPADQRGTYLHPAAHGKPLSAGVDYPMQQRIAAMRAGDKTRAAATTG